MELKLLFTLIMEEEFAFPVEGFSEEWEEKETLLVKIPVIAYQKKWGTAN